MAKGQLNVFTDRKSRFAKEVQTVYAEIITDLGGPAHTTAMQRELVKRSAFLIGTLRKMEVVGEEVDVDIYAKAAGALSRLMRTLRDRAVVPEKIEREPGAALKEYLEGTPSRQRPRLVE